MPILEEYLAKKTGKLLVMLDPSDNFKQPSPMPRLTGLLKEWGINATESVVVDLSGRTTGRDGAGECTTLSLARASRRGSASSRCSRSCARSRQPPTRRRIARDNRSFRRRHGAGRKRTSPRLEDPSKLAAEPEKGDVAGPVSIAVATAVPAPSPEKPDATPASNPPDAAADQAPKPETRVAAIGDSDFAANAYLGIEGNRDLFMNTVNWLAQQENLIAIRPREAADRRITLTANTATGMFWLTIVRDSGDRPRRRRLHLVAEALACAGSGPPSSWSSSLAGLVGYIYFVDSKREPSGTTAKEKPFTSVQADDIEEVQIKSADGETTRLQKADGKWQLVEPVKAAADTSEVDHDCEQPGLARDPARRRRERERPEAVRARAGPDRGRLPVEGAERISGGCRSARRPRPAAISTRVFPIRSACSSSRRSSTPRSTRTRSRCATGGSSSSTATWWMDWS